MKTSRVYHDALAAWLRGNSSAALRLVKTGEAEFLHYLDLHGLGPILAAREAEKITCERLRRFLHQRLLARELWEAQHRRVMNKALGVLIDAGSRPLLFKGTALAWSRYPRPATRVRGDSDVLIEGGKREAAVRALDAAGFLKSLEAGGSTLIGETLFQGRDPMGRLHDIDLHWRLNNSLTVSRHWTHAELWERSQPLDALAPGARRVGDVDALLIACVHRRLHLSGWRKTHLNGESHATPDSLTWLLDLDLLMRALLDHELSELEERAKAKDLARIVATALATVRTQLGTPVPEDLIGRLSATPRTGVDRYVEARPARQLALDFVSTGPVTTKVRFLRELLFPPADYMRARFADRPHAPLAALYLRRLLDGVRSAGARGRLMK